MYVCVLVDEYMYMYVSDNVYRISPKISMQVPTNKQVSMCAYTSGEFCVGAVLAMK